MIITNLHIGSRFPVNRAVLRETVTRVLQHHGVEEAQVEVSVVGQRKMKQLNEGLMKHEGTTDVLSFPQHERHQLNDFPMPAGMPPLLGDVVICFPVAVENARRYGKRVDEQLAFYLEHGLMHLLGYHHD